MTSLQDRNRALERVRKAVLVPGERERSGIGEQNEKTLHQMLKNCFDPDPEHQEIPVGNYIADICSGRDITEIQTASFGALRGKLSCFLPDYHVRIVYPIPHIKYVTWVDPETGELTERNRSTLRGNWYLAFKELYRIRPFLPDPNLTLDLLLIDMEEYRIRDGWGQEGKRGSHRYDRVPTEIADELILERPSDWKAFLPESLPEQFTSSDLKACCGTKRRSIEFSTVLLLLSDQGIIERCGKQGRSILYRRT